MALLLYGTYGTSANAGKATQTCVAQICLAVKARVPCGGKLEQLSTLYGLKFGIELYNCACKYQGGKSACRKDLRPSNKFSLQKKQKPCNEDCTFG